MTTPIGEFWGIAARAIERGKEIVASPGTSEIVRVRTLGMNDGVVWCGDVLNHLLPVEERGSSFTPAMSARLKRWVQGDPDAAGRRLFVNSLMDAGVLQRTDGAWVLSPAWFAVMESALDDVPGMEN